MKHLKYLYLIIMIFIGASCAKDQLPDSPAKMYDDVNSSNIFSPKIKIAVVSDIHYLDLSLMPVNPETNTYFQNDMCKDRKLTELSDPIFKNVISGLISEKPDIVLITGDLANRGELASHETVKNFLQQLEDEGMKVYVIPGNNDINSSKAVSYKSSPPEKVANINKDLFVTLYNNFGYNATDEDARYRDPKSLSYICQPCTGLWILGIDAITSGNGIINPATMTWIQEKMVEANENNITVLAMMHYGILEHYTGQNGPEPPNGPEPLIKDSKANAIALMNAGIRLIFTGHYHANDIVDFVYEGKILSDIETGSLVTPPCSYRIMTLDDNFIKIDTRRVTDVVSEITGEMDFLTYSDKNITKRLNGFFCLYLPLLFNVTNEQAEFAAPYLTNGIKAYFAGDEKISPAEKNNIKVLEQYPYSSLFNLLNSFWTDLPPKDNKIHIKLK